MILVLAAARDRATDAFAAELAPTPAAVLTYEQLACEPSCLRDPDFAASTLTLAGEQVPVARISGVVNTLPAVLPECLTMYAPTEREYQAAEMHAWLAYLLSTLECPVVSRPTASSLTGPAPNPLGWLALARAAGVPTVEMELDSGEAADPPAPARASLEVTVLDGTPVRESGTAADRHTVELARRHGLAYLTARYAQDGAEPRLASATSVPNLRDALVRRALAAMLARA